MRKFLLLFFALVCVQVGAWAGTRYYLVNAGGTPPSVGTNNGDKAIVGATLYKSTKQQQIDWSIAQPSDNGGNFDLFPYPESERSNHLQEAESNKYYKVAQNLVYYQKVDGEWTPINNKPDAPTHQIAMVEDDLSNMPEWQQSQMSYAIVYSNIVGYYHTTQQDVYVWVEESYSDDWKELEGVYASKPELDAISISTEGKYAAVGGTTWTKQDGRWVSDTPEIVTGWDANTGTLSIAPDETRTISELMTEYGITADNVNKIVFDGGEYDKETKTLTSSSDDYSAQETALTAAEFEVEKIVLGDYVTIENGVTIFTVPNNNTTSVLGSNIDSNLLTEAEKYAIMHATDLKLVGKITKDDWSALNDKAGSSPAGHYVESLDLSDAIINDGNSSDPFVLTQGKQLQKVTHITLPNNPNYTSVPEKFAFGASNLSSVHFPEHITEIGSSAFSGTGIKELTLPGSITQIGDHAFFACPNLEKVIQEELGVGVSCTFESNVFESCTELKHVTLSEGVTAISEHMFDKCGQLESIRIPTTCATIEAKAFNICASLHTIIIPEGVQLIEAGAFANSGLADVYVMARTMETVPRIYCAPKRGGDGSFTENQIDGRLNSPKESSHTVADAENASSEEVLSWYQEELSNPHYGLGGNNCMVQLHYPEEMKYFYDGVDNPLAGSSIDDPASSATEKRGWMSQIHNDRHSAALIGPKLNNSEYITDGYAIDNGDTDYPAYIDKDGNAWPLSPDFIIRLGAGYVDGNVPSRLGWRQFPLQKAAGNDDYIFSKLYDDTWYTMCFPWDMDDNTLFRAFNQNCEITEFVGVEVIEDEASTAEQKQYTLVFHFDEVAKTYYVTKNHEEDGLEYIRLRIPEPGEDENLAEGIKDFKVGGKSTTREEEFAIDGGTTTKKYYTYYRIKGDKGPEYVYWPFDMPVNYSERSEEDKIMCDAYEDIMHMMVFAGHPYMIHPSIGASPGTPKNCDFVGVRKLVGDDAQMEKRADDNKVTKQTTTDGKSYHTPGTTYFPETSHYTFIGNINDYPDDVDVKGKDMLSTKYPVAYFLGVKEGSNYPKYYRKSKGGEKKWSQYSAIVRPEADALNVIEPYIHPYVGNTYQAKAFDVEFGPWEEVSVTAIKEILADAEEKGENVQKINLNVVFNVKGQIVRQGTSSVEGLPSGLYIVNGKKYMVK